MNETVEISALEAAGVDNWEGISDAGELYEELYPTGGYR